MGTILNREGYEKLIQEDLEWLRKQPRTLEREHIELIVSQSPDQLYGKKPEEPQNPLRCECGCMCHKVLEEHELAYWNKHPGARKLCGSCYTAMMHR